MNMLPTTLPNIYLDAAEPDRDAPFAYRWFSGAHGRETLTLMGNAPHEIHESTLEKEYETFASFVALEKAGTQITRVIRCDDQTIGVIWLELVENHDVKAPSIHIMIGDPIYRGKGIGYAAMKAMIDFARVNLGARHLYSRHLKNNEAISRLNKQLGFQEDGMPYTDGNGLEWQQVSLEL